MNSGYYVEEILSSPNNTERLLAFGVQNDMIFQNPSITISQLLALEDLCVIKSHNIQRISSLLDDQVNFQRN